MPTFDTRQEMMCLAALTYRGFSDPTIALPHQSKLQGLVGRALEDNAVTRGHWELVFGPVSYRAPFSVLDDAMVYVVRHRDDRSRYVVAIRGTNPVSAFDWLFGDLWVSVQLPWPYGGAPRDAKISFSTALGLGVVQGMRADPPPKGVATELWKRVADGIGARLRERGNAVIDAVLGAPVLVARHAVSALVAVLAEAQRQRMNLTAAVRPAALLAEWSSEVRGAALAETAGLVNGLSARFSHALLAALRVTAEGTTSGATLVELLRAASEDGPIDVTVVGHSKGGGLASTVALWLADTQGEKGIPDDERWDAAGTSTVRCYSFAGPTAGNAAFAAHSNAVIDARCERVLNTLDIVPHAWALDDLKGIAGGYGPGPDRQPIAALLEQISGDHKALKLGYTHPGNMVHTIAGRLDPSRPLFFDQCIHQHLQGYFVGLDLDGELSQDKIFARL